MVHRIISSEKDSGKKNSLVREAHKIVDELEQVDISVKIRDLYAASNSSWRYEPKIRDTYLKAKI